MQCVTVVCLHSSTTSVSAQGKQLHLLVQVPGLALVNTGNTSKHKWKVRPGSRAPLVTARHLKLGCPDIQWLARDKGDLVAAMFEIWA
jgi:hypothetical protein